MNFFNEFFICQCTSLKNGSECPSQLILYTNTRLSSVVFDDQDNIKIIEALNIHKAYDHNDISIRMIKIYDSTLVKPLSITFNNSLKTGTFPYIWKKSVIPVHKKMISNSLIIINLFHYSQYLVKFLKG